MTETIKYGLIGKQDLALRAVGGASNFSVTLPDGSVVTIDRIALNDLIAFGIMDLNLNQLQNALAEVRSANPTTQTQGRFWYISGVIRYSDGSTALEVVELAATQTLTNKTLTSPKIGTAITDTAGNEIIETPATASAVNHIKITNAATGSNVLLDAVGGDTDVTLNIRSKGAGNVLINGVVPTSLPIQAGSADKFLQTDGTQTLWASAVRPASVETITGAYTFSTAPSIANPTITGAAPATPVANVLYSDLVIKGWVKFSTAAVIAVDVNVSSITDNGPADWTINWATAFSSANYAAAGNMAGGSADRWVNFFSQTASALQVQSRNNAGGLDETTATDALVIAIGVQ